MTETRTWAVPQSSDSEGQASDFLQQLQDDAQDEGKDLEQCSGRPAKRQRVYGSAAGCSGVPTPDVRDQHAQALPSMAAQAEGQGPLHGLTEDLVLRVLCFLSPEDLAAAAPTCTLLRDCTSQDLLWQRHFSKRWPHIASQASKPEGGWKRLYLQHDAQDMHQALDGVPPEMQHIYREMTASKRSLLLSKAETDGLLVPIPALVRVDRAADWRAAHGFARQQTSGEHTCQGPVTFVQIQDVHMCKQCGWAHVCGPNCTERIMDTVTGLPVCPISGTCFDQMMTAWEEEDGRGEEDEAIGFEGDLQMNSYGA
eukprot:jgi/Astpho2/2363/Aster-x0528